MLRTIARKNRAHFDTVSDLVKLEMPMQYSAGVFLCGICWYYGWGIFAFAVLGCITVSEACIALIARHKSCLAQLPQDTQLIILLVLSSTNAVLYMLPAMVLVAFLPPALQITGILWLMGAQIFITNSWTRVPLFLYAMLTPVIIMMVITFLILSTSIHAVSPSGQWIIAFAFVGLFIYSSISTLRQNIKREADLLLAKNSASSRLALLEEAQRVDALTGLLNRTAFDAALAAMLNDRERAGGEITVLLLDLDSFKPVNDTYSHAAGDAVLVATAQRIKNRIGNDGIVCRMNGDEFVCAMSDLSSDQDALDLAEDLISIISRPIPWNERNLRIAASVGISMTGADADAAQASVSALCAAADQAMFVAKSSPSRVPVLYKTHQFKPRMSPDDKQFLVEAISNGAVRAFYQPKYHLTTGQIVGFEALARWRHPTLGERAPGEFIEQINELGLQGDFIMSIAKQVFEDVDTLLALGFDPGQVSLNVSEVVMATYSGRQELQRLLAAHPLVANYMTFEITEDVFFARAADVIQSSIATFRGLGVRISLDDFGTGFASFAHLRELDFDELKIDTSFVAGLGKDSTSEVLVRGFLDISSGLGVGVVAEGVETEAQRQDLINMGCVVAQGYLFSAAVPFEQATNLLKDQEEARRA